MKRVIILTGSFIFLFIFTFSIFYFTFNNSRESSNNVIFKNGIIYSADNSEVFTGKVCSEVQKRKIEYEVSEGMKNGKFTLYFTNGNIEMTGTMKNNKNEGAWKYFYINGKIESEGPFKNDITNGRWKWYYKNGNVKEEGVFINGMREGLWLFYKEDGSLSSKIYFRNGERINEIKLNMSLIVA